MVYEANRVIDEKIDSDRKRKAALCLTALLSFLFGAFVTLSVYTVLFLCLM